MTNLYITETTNKGNNCAFAAIVAHLIKPQDLQDRGKYAGQDISSIAESFRGEITKKIKVKALESFLTLRNIVPQNQEEQNQLKAQEQSTDDALKRAYSMYKDYEMLDAHDGLAEIAKSLNIGIVLVSNVTSAKGMDYAKQIDYIDSKGAVCVPANVRHGKDGQDNFTKIAQAISKESKAPIVLYLEHAHYHILTTDADQESHVRFLTKEEILNKLTPLYELLESETKLQDLKMQAEMSSMFSLEAIPTEKITEAKARLHEAQKTAKLNVEFKKEYTDIEIKENEWNEDYKKISEYNAATLQDNMVMQNAVKRLDGLEQAYKEIKETLHDFNLYVHSARNEAVQQGRPTEAAWNLHMQLFNEFVGNILNKHEVINPQIYELKELEYIIHKALTGVNSAYYVHLVEREGKPYFMCGQADAIMNAVSSMTNGLNSLLISKEIIESFGLASPALEAELQNAFAGVSTVVKSTEGAREVLRKALNDCLKTEFESKVRVLEITEKTIKLNTKDNLYKLIDREINAVNEVNKVFNNDKNTILYVALSNLVAKDYMVFDSQQYFKDNITIDEKGNYSSKDYKFQEQEQKVVAAVSAASEQKDVVEEIIDTSGSIQRNNQEPENGSRNQAEQIAQPNAEEVQQNEVAQALQKITAALKEIVIQHRTTIQLDNLPSDIIDREIQVAFINLPLHLRSNEEFRKQLIKDLNDTFTTEYTAYEFKVLEIREGGIALNTRVNLHNAIEQELVSYYSTGDNSEDAMKLQLKKILESFKDNAYISDKIYQNLINDDPMVKCIESIRNSDLNNNLLINKLHEKILTLTSANGTQENVAAMVDLYSELPSLFNNLYHKEPKVIERITKIEEVVNPWFKQHNAHYKVNGVDLVQGKWNNDKFDEDANIVQERSFSQELESIIDKSKFTAWNPVLEPMYQALNLMNQMPSEYNESAAQAFCTMYAHVKGGIVEGSLIMATNLNDDEKPKVPEKVETIEKVFKSMITNVALKKNVEIDFDHGTFKCQDNILQLSNAAIESQYILDAQQKIITYKLSSASNYAFRGIIKLKRNLENKDMQSLYNCMEDISNQINGQCTEEKVAHLKELYNKVFKISEKLSLINLSDKVNLDIMSTLVNGWFKNQNQPYAVVKDNLVEGKWKDGKFNEKQNIIQSLNLATINENSVDDDQSAEDSQTSDDDSSDNQAQRADEEGQLDPQDNVAAAVQKITAALKEIAIKHEASVKMYGLPTKIMNEQLQEKFLELDLSLRSNTEFRKQLNNDLNATFAQDLSLAGFRVIGIGKDSIVLNTIKNWYTMIYNHAIKNFNANTSQDELKTALNVYLNKLKDNWISNDLLQHLTKNITIEKNGSCTVEELKWNSFNESYDEVLRKRKMAEENQSQSDAAQQDRNYLSQSASKDSAQQNNQFLSKSASNNDDQQAYNSSRNELDLAEWNALLEKANLMQAVGESGSECDYQADIYTSILAINNYLNSDNLNDAEKLNKCEDTLKIINDAIETLQILSAPCLEEVSKDIKLLKEYYNLSVFKIEEEQDNDSTNPDELTGAIQEQLTQSQHDNSTSARGNTASADAAKLTQILEDIVNDALPNELQVIETFLKQITQLGPIQKLSPDEEKRLKSTIEFTKSIFDKAREADAFLLDNDHLKNTQSYKALESKVSATKEVLEGYQADLINIVGQHIGDGYIVDDNKLETVKSFWLDALFHSDCLKKREPDLKPEQLLQHESFNKGGMFAALNNRHYSKLLEAFTQVVTKEYRNFEPARTAEDATMQIQERTLQLFKEYTLPKAIDEINNLLYNNDTFNDKQINGLKKIMYNTSLAHSSNVLRNHEVLKKLSAFKNTKGYFNLLQEYTTINEPFNTYIENLIPIVGKKIGAKYIVIGRNLSTLEEARKEVLDCFNSNKEESPGLTPEKFLQSTFSGEFAALKDSHYTKLNADIKLEVAKLCKGADVGKQHHAVRFASGTNFKGDSSSQSMIKNTKKKSGTLLNTTNEQQKISTAKVNTTKLVPVKNDTAKIAAPQKQKLVTSKLNTAKLAAPIKQKLAPQKQKLAPQKQKLAPIKQKLASANLAAPIKQKLAPQKQNLAPQKQKLASANLAAPIKQKLASANLAPQKQKFAPIKHKVATKNLVQVKNDTSKIVQVKKLVLQKQKDGASKLNLTKLAAPQKQKDTAKIVQVKNDTAKIMQVKNDTAKIMQVKNDVPQKQKPVLQKQKPVLQKQKPVLQKQKDTENLVQGKKAPAKLAAHQKQKLAPQKQKDTAKIMQGKKDVPQKHNLVQVKKLAATQKQKDATKNHDFIPKLNLLEVVLKQGQKYLQEQSGNYTNETTFKNFEYKVAGDLKNNGEGGE